MSRTSRVLFATAAFLTVANAPVRNSPDSTQDQILVVSDRDSARMRGEFVKALAQPSAMDQLGRFHDPVCPVVLGLREPYNAMVANRMRRVASAAGMRVDSQACHGNAFLFVVRDKSQMLAKLRHSYSEVFGDPDLTSESKINALVDSDSPSVAWQVLQYRSFDGRPLYRERFRRNGSADSVLEVPVQASRIVNPLRVEFGAAVMVVEAKSILGADLRQLADFAAMQLFAHTNPDVAMQQSAPTILSLLADAKAQRPAPLSVTHWDLAYLKSLYSFSDLYRVNGHYGELSNLMKRSMEEQQAQPAE